MDRELAVSMRENGMTYQEIANHFGVSRQRVHQIMRGKPVPRRHSKIYDNIPYKGLCDFFRQNKTVTISTLCRECFHCTSRPFQKKIFDLLSGRDTALSVEQIRRLTRYTGKTWEELFEI